jgi:hypothetical protein
VGEHLQATDLKFVDGTTRSALFKFTVTHVRGEAPRGPLTIRPVRTTAAGGRRVKRMPAAGTTTASVAPTATAATPLRVGDAADERERGREEARRQIREAHQATALDRGGVTSSAVAEM